MTTEHMTTEHMTDGYETVLVERKGRTALLTLNRPKALNALNLRVMNEVVAATEALDRDPDCGCIVITGSAKAFAAGADIKEMQPQGTWTCTSPTGSPPGTGSDSSGPRPSRPSPDTPSAGCELAMLCDILLAADTAVFGSRRSSSG